MTTDIIDPNQEVSDDNNFSSNSGIIPQNLDDLMKNCYLNYSVSVILQRALPDVRDGLKPVHRRVLYAMHEENLGPHSKHKKSARIVGNVIGKYHPHGDIAVYEAAVKMAQPWSKLIPLIDGQGNFGSIDGDSPAAMRYTEMRMTRGGAAFFEDLNKNTVDFKDNYDNSEQEPTVLPVTYPNLWVNGTSGIAVGMATNILPHNLGETVDAMLAWIENPNITVDELLDIIPGPDFPTGGLVHELSGFRDAIVTGRGRVKVRAKWHLETNKKGSDKIVIYELPYEVVKSNLVEKIGELVKEKVVEDVSEVRDESKADVRIVIDLKRGANPDLIFNQLLSQTELEKSYSYNVMAVDGVVPRQFGLLMIFSRFFDFRKEVIRRRTEFDLKKTNDRLHILDGLIKALADIDNVVASIRSANDPQDARDKLKTLLTISDIQAQEILSLRLQSLTSLEVDVLKKEQAAFILKSNDLTDILNTPSRIVQLIKDELLEAKQKFGKPRKSEISKEMLGSINMEHLIKKEPCLIHLTHAGYVKRMAISELSTQNRNTQGKSGIATSADDYVSAVYTGNTHDNFLIFTESGQVYSKRVWQIPEGPSSQRGRHLRNLFDDLNEKISVVMFVPSFEEEGVYLVTATANGKVKRTPLIEYAGSLRKTGVVGLTIDENDTLIGAQICREFDNIILGASDGRVIRFEVSDDQIRSIGRTSSGVRGIKLGDHNKVISLMVLPGNGEPLPIVQKPSNDDPSQMIDVADTSSIDNCTYLLCIGEKGAGKRTHMSEFNIQNRAGKGVMGFKINKKTGNIVSMALVSKHDHVVLTTPSKTNRIRVESVQESSRVTAGSYLINVQKDKVIDVAIIKRNENSDSEDELLLSEINEEKETV